MQRPLSELMREGAKMVPQMTGAYYEDGKACALGAAALAAGVMVIKPEGDGHYGMIDDQFAAISAMGVGLAIINFNDFHCWSREKIADWLVSSGNDMLIDCKQIPVEKVLEVRERELVAV